MTAQLRLVENTGTALRAGYSPSQVPPRTYFYGNSRQFDFLSQENPDPAWKPRPGSGSQNLSSSIQLILEELGRLTDGWLGEDSIAPRQTVVRDIQMLAPILPLGARTPEVEVDPSDGEVRLAWRAANEPKSIAISLTGNGMARVIQVDLTGSVSNPIVEIELLPTRAHGTERTLQLLEHSGLFVGV